MQFKDKEPDYWKKRAKSGTKAIKESNAGRPKSFDSPEQLWELACLYFERCDNTPWMKKDYKGKDAIEVDIPTTSPYLWTGFEDFLFEKGICKSMKDYRTASRNPEYEQGRYKEFSEVVTRIDKIMTTQKVAGAAVGAYNSNLVARLEGLVDKTENEVIIKETKVGFE